LIVLDNRAPPSSFSALTLPVLISDADQFMQLDKNTLPFPVCESEVGKAREKMPYPDWSNVKMMFCPICRVGFDVEKERGDNQRCPNCGNMSQLIPQERTETAKEKSVGNT
jgi:hypothetical protein